jgi:hypothetical protein
MSAKQWLRTRRRTAEELCGGDIAEWQECMVEETCLCNHLEGNTITAEIVITLQSPSGDLFKANRVIKFKLTRE